MRVLLASACAAILVLAAPSAFSQTMIFTGSTSISGDSCASAGFNLDYIAGTQCSYYYCDADVDGCDVMHIEGHWLSQPDIIYVEAYIPVTM